MNPGSVIVDVSVDQGGCIETTRPTTHEDPIFVEEGVTHYCVSNMPGSVPYTSTLSLCNATIHYIKHIANLGLEGLKKDNSLLKGVNVFRGKVTHAAVANSFNVKYHSPIEVL